jgi:Uma2 family endonuclease
MITNINQLDSDKIYSYADYLSWGIQGRLELIRGKISKMNSSRSTLHQKVSMNLAGILWSELRNYPCNLFSAPFDVRIMVKNKLTLDKDIFTVVQPDLCVIRDEDKLDERGAFGAPDLVIEILSPGNSDKEMKYKFDLYQEAGVLEYWIINPQNKTLLIYILKEGKFIGMHPLIKEDEIKSPLFPQLDFVLERIFR